MSTETKKGDKETTPAPPEKKKAPVVVVRLLRSVRGIVNNPGEVCGFPPKLAQQLLDKNRPGGACAELYEPPKK